MTFFEKIKKALIHPTKRIYLVDIKTDKTDPRKFQIHRILDRNDNPIDIDPGKYFYLSESWQFPDEILYLISELTGEPVEEISYHINEEE